MEFDKEKIKEEALKNHEKMSTLFKNNRFMFEIETKKQIQEFIDNAPLKHKKGLIELQKKWNTAMKGAGSKHNRLAIAQNILMDHIINNFQPAVESLKETIQNVGVCNRKRRLREVSRMD